MTTGRKISPFNYSFAFNIGFKGLQASYSNVLKRNGARKTEQYQECSRNSTIKRTLRGDHSGL